ncbi:MAG TPA: CHAD domain-containing protein [Acidimicrobiales bacterium]
MLSGPAEITGRPLSWQFDALDLRPAERWLAGLPLRAAEHDAGTLATQAGPSVRLVDRYLDTEDWRIGRAGFSLRVRRHGRRHTVTLRPITELVSGGPSSADVTEPVSDGAVSAVRAAPRVGPRVGAVIGRRPPVQILEVRTHRRPFVVRCAGVPLLEVLLDDTAIVVAGGPPVHLRRVQVTAIEPAEPQRRSLALALVEELRSSSGLRVASLSKFAAGLLAVGVGVPGPPDLGPLSTGPAATLGELAFATIRRQLVAISAHEPGTRLGEDPEELHDMRVATRRLRAALELFAEALPARATHLHGEVGWIASVLGDVRDLDVQLGRLDEMERWVARWAESAGLGRPLDQLRLVLDNTRRHHRAALLEALDSARWERLVSELSAVARQGPSRRSAAARSPAAVSAPELVRRRHRAVTRAARRAAASGLAEDFHRLRIRCKRLRYTLEFTEALYGRRATRFAQRLARLQDKLGLMQDAEVATAALLGAATDLDRSLPALTVFAMGGIAERYRAEAASLLAELPGRLQVLRGGEWEDLAELMDRRAAAAVSPIATLPPLTGPTNEPANGSATGTANGTRRSANGATASSPIRSANASANGSSNRASDGSATTRTPATGTSGPPTRPRSDRSAPAVRPPRTATRTASANAPASKAAGRKTPPRGAPANAPASKAAARKAPPRGAPARKTASATPARKTPARKTPARNAPARAPSKAAAGKAPSPTVPAARARRVRASKAGPAAPGRP